MQKTFKPISKKYTVKTLVSFTGVPTFVQFTSQHVYLCGFQLQINPYHPLQYCSVSSRRVL
jgi:hypothetical protein